MLQKALILQPAAQAPDVLYNMYTIPGDNVPKPPVVQRGDSSGHDNLVAWKYLYNPVTILCVMREPEETQNQHG